jgi:adenylate cyclase
VFTALGDAVNVAARLQDMTKTLNCTVVISDEVRNSAGIPPNTLERTEVSIRGRDQPMTVCMAADPTLLASLLDEQARLLSAEKMSAQLLV